MYPSGIAGCRHSNFIAKALSINTYLSYDIASSCAFCTFIQEGVSGVWEISSLVVQGSPPPGSWSKRNTLFLGVYISHIKEDSNWPSLEHMPALYQHYTRRIWAFCYWAKLGSTHPHGKTNLLTSVVVRKVQHYCRTPSRENGWLMLKRPKLPKGFQGRDFKGKLKERVAECLISSWIFFWLVGGEVTGWYLVS